MVKRTDKWWDKFLSKMYVFDTTTYRKEGAIRTSRISYKKNVKSPMYKHKDSDHMNSSMGLGY